MDNGGERESARRAVGLGWVFGRRRRWLVGWHRNRNRTGGPRAPYVSAGRGGPGYRAAAKVMPQPPGGPQEGAQRISAIGPPTRRCKRGALELKLCTLEVSQSPTDPPCSLAGSLTCPVRAYRLSYEILFSTTLDGRRRTGWGGWIGPYGSFRRRTTARGFCLGICRGQINISNSAS